MATHRRASSVQLWIMELLLFRFKDADRIQLATIQDLVRNEIPHSKLPAYNDLLHPYLLRQTNSVLKKKAGHAIIDVESSIPGKTSSLAVKKVAMTENEVAMMKRRAVTQTINDLQKAKRNYEEACSAQRRHADVADFDSVIEKLLKIA